MKKTTFISLFAVLFFFVPNSFSQNQLHKKAYGKYVQNYLEKYKDNFAKVDLEDLIVVNEYVTNKTKTTHIYINQQFQGIKIFNAVSSIALKDGKVVYFANSFVKNVKEKINSTNTSITPIHAVNIVATHFQLGTVANYKKISSSAKAAVFSIANISKEDIPVNLVYALTADGQLKLSWDLNINTLDEKHYWNARVDAVSGELIEVNDLVISCNFDIPNEASTSSHKEYQSEYKAPFNLFKTNGSILTDDAQYTVFPLPIESPNHGSRQVVTNPANLLASPYGWHDKDGVAGPEHTITHGNNVHAYEDINSTNNPGYRPDGGSNLAFNYTLDLNDSPYTNDAQAQNLNAAITNLFYMTNITHDIWYNYGFDEQAGNFQANNYGRGGIDRDIIRAEALDGSGTNNANFLTRPDGGNGRMQMYLWKNTKPEMFLTINSPILMAGSYLAVAAAFGPDLYTTPVTGDMVLITDDIEPLNDGCNTITNPDALNGKIVIIDRGDCAYSLKVENAQNFGAIGVIIVNNVPGTATMGGTNPNILIPSIMISQEDGSLLKEQLLLGAVNGSLESDVTTIGRASSFDNGTVVHEYGHGISTRLTGGASIVTCLSNEEQMGEGWSDWFELVSTIQPGDTPEKVRGNGTYVNFDPITGNGIRTYPYSTDMEINPLTYDFIKTESIPHGVGTVWCAMLWDLTWAYIDKYGFDPDLYNGTGGNNKMMQLVIDGLKLQPCNPGFIDGRDALLAADEILTGGADKCLIWSAFAKRGLGFSATQGSSLSRSDGVEAFDTNLDISIAIDTDVCGSQTIIEIDFFKGNSAPNSLSQIDYSYVIDGGTPITNSWLGDVSNCETVTEIVTISEQNRGTHVINIAATSPSIPTKSFLFNTNDSGTENEINHFELSENVLIAFDKDKIKSTWIQGDASGSLLSNSVAGSKVYGTNLSGLYPNATTSYLVSQCYNLSNLQNTFIKFDMAFDTELDFDVLYLEYSTDGGRNWSVLGTAADTDWYNSSNVDCTNCVGAQWTGEGELASNHSARGTNATMHSYKYPLSGFDSTGSAETNMLFRFVLDTDSALAQEGAIIDNLVIEGTQNNLMVNKAQFKKLSIYPNPSNGQLTIESATNLKDANVYLFDILGRTLSSENLNKSINDNIINININEFASGTYMLIIEKDNYKSTRRIIKK